LAAAHAARTAARLPLSWGDRTDGPGAFHGGELKGMHNLRTRWVVKYGAARGYVSICGELWKSKHACLRGRGRE